METVAAYASSKSLKHTLLPDPRQLAQSRYKYPIPAMPFHVLVGRDGRVVRSGGSLPSDADIEAALK